MPTTSVATPPRDLHSVKIPQTSPARTTTTVPPGQQLLASTHAGKPSSELDDLYRTARRLNVGVWGVAGGVMVYGAINVTVLLVSHDVMPAVAWMLSIMIDLGLCVALWGDRLLHRYGRQDRWVTALRWITALMSWLLNIARPALATTPQHTGADAGSAVWTPDWVGVGIHSCGPLLLLVVAEAAGSIQRQLTTLTGELERTAAEADTVTDALRAELADAQAAATGNERRIAALTEKRDSAVESAAAAETACETVRQRAEMAQRDADRERTARTDAEARLRDAESQVVALSQVSAPGPRPGHVRREGAARRRLAAATGGTGAAATAKEIMWTYWSQCRASGRTPCGADLDEVAGTNNYGRAILRQWLEAEQISSAEFAAAARTAGQHRSRRHTTVGSAEAGAA